MNLSKTNLSEINTKEFDTPTSNYFNLPEKVLQFGTGVLLRGLPGYFIDKANKQNIFNGRIVVVKSTGSDVNDFESQDGLYTHCIRGIEDGKKSSQNIINASISRVLSAVTDWEAILHCATNPAMQLVISNTTEVGIVLLKEDIHASPPQSFPGKLLAFLVHRYRHFNGDPAKGLVIIPTELIPDNASKLLAILLELATLNGLDDAFFHWLKNANYFCNSLVDRIVPGKLPGMQQKEMEGLLGCSDGLMIMSEVYRLWAIESSNESVKQILSFSQVDEGVIIAPDIHGFRQLKLRLLNGSHTFSCGLAFFAGFITVKEAMDDTDFSTYIKDLMLKEIAPAITSDHLTITGANHFAAKVLDRYRNPYIEHQWLAITLQYASKMSMRNVPVIVDFIQRFGAVPHHIALGFAAHILFMRCEKSADGKYYGEKDGKKYPVNDDYASWYSEKWKQYDDDVAGLVQDIFNNELIWKTDLAVNTAFTTAVIANLSLIMKEGVQSAIATINESGRLQKD